LLITGDGNQTDVLSTELLTGSIPAFAPDGNKLAYLTGENSPGSLGIEVIDPNNTDSKIILFSDGFPGYTIKQGILPRIMWSGDSREISLAFVGDSTDFIEIIETETGARTTIEISAVLGAAQPDISPDRNFVAFVSDDGKIWARNIEGQPKFFEISKLTGERKNVLPEWAPEGGKVLYHSADGSGQISSFYTLFAADYGIAGDVLSINGLTVISNNVYRGFWKIK
jgi:Tol biopolymer transport system component